MLDLYTPQVIVLEGEVDIQLRIDGEHDAISLRCQVVETVDLRQFGAPDELDLESITDGKGKTWLQIRTHDPHLWPYFLSFSETIVDAIQLRKLDVMTAVKSSIRLFRRLLRDVRLISREEVLGLMGELWTLNRLIDSRGSAAFEAWTGPVGEAHDFRFGSVELEVKTTSRKHRVHLINGVNQLEPSPGTTLYLVSVQLAAAGAADDGTSLEQSLSATRERLVQYDQADTFGQLLISHFALPPEDESRYQERFRLRSRTVLVKVDEGVPRLSSSDILDVSRPEMSRILDVTYSLDVEGLGVSDGTPEFESILPPGEPDV